VRRRRAGPEGEVELAMDTGTRTWRLRSQHRVIEQGDTGVARRRGRLHGDDFIFLVAVLLQLVPLVVLRYVVTADGPSHLAGAAVLAHYSDPDSSVLRQYYRIDLSPSSNLLTELLLAGMMRLVSPGSAEKLLVVGYSIAFPLSVRYAIGAVERGALWLAFLALPFTFNPLFFMGFYNFCYGVALSMFTIGFALRHRRSWNLRTTVILALLYLLTYGAHLLPFVMALGFIGIVATSDAVGWLRKARRPGLLSSEAVRDLGGRLLPPVLAALPAFALAMSFLVRTDQAGPSGMVRRPVGRLVAGLGTLIDLLVSYTSAEVVCSLLLALVFAYLIVGTVRRVGWRAVRGPAAPFAAAVLFALLICLVVPDQVGQFSSINSRLGLYVALFLVLWLAAQPVGGRIQWLSCIVALAVALTLTAVRIPTQARYDSYVAEFDQARHVLRPNSTLLTLRVRFDRPRFLRRSPDPLLHETGRLAAETKGVDVNHYEAMLAYFPVQFRPQYNLQRRFGSSYDDLKTPSTWAELLKDGRLAGKGADYVLLWGVRRASQSMREDPGFVEAMSELARNYRLIYVSKPLGLVQVYMRR
jgi:hypothetical protein